MEEDSRKMKSMVFELNESKELGENIGAKAKQYFADQSLATQTRDAKAVSSEGIITLPSYDDMMMEVTRDEPDSGVDTEASNDDHSEAGFMKSVHNMWNYYYPKEGGEKSSVAQPSSGPNVLDAAASYDHDVDRQS